MKALAWILIAWKPLPSRDTVTVELQSKFPITEAKALALFRKNRPGLRNYTAQPKGEA